MKSYNVRYELDETGWWVAKIVAVPGCHTQGRTIEQAEERIREALAALVGDRAAKAAKLINDIQLPPVARKAIAESASKRAKAEALAKQAQQATIVAARTLIKEGLSFRDIGTVLGISRQRAHQILSGSDSVISNKSVKKANGIPQRRRRARASA